MDDQWRTTRCERCRGYGVVSAYTPGGTDFLGAAECGRCGGSGRLYIRPGGAVAHYPGGPFCGMYGRDAYVSARPVPAPEAEAVEA